MKDIRQLYKFFIFLICTIPALCLAVPMAGMGQAVLLALSASNGEILPLAKAGRFQLSVSQVAPKVTYFTDRPARIAGRRSLRDLSNIWDQGDHSFAKVPPNAILFYTDAKTDKTYEAVIELLSQKVDVKDKTVVYQFSFLTEKVVPSNSIKQVRLVIDNWSPHGW